MQDIRQAIKHLNLVPDLLHGDWGVEVEEHRLKTDGHLSDYPYPTTFASRNFHPTLQSDFGESQMELVTLPESTPKQTMAYLDVLQTIVHQSLRSDEVIWPLSFPPFLSDVDKAVIKTHFGRPKFQAYRDYLKATYGIEQELITGLHMNASIPEPVFKRLYQQEPAPKPDFITYKNTLYFRIAQHLAVLRWLITYFFGASPISENHYWRLPRTLDYPVRSLRSSSFGFSNTPDVKIGYTTLAQQVNEIDAEIQKGKFFSNHEFYGPVRVKGSDDLPKLEAKGIKYLEMRMFDLDPFVKDLVNHQRLLFVQLLFIYSLATPVPEDMAAAYETANQLNDEVALGRPDRQPKWFYDRSEAIFQQLYHLIDFWQLPERFRQVLDTLGPQLKDPRLTLGAHVAQAIKHDSLLDFGRSQGLLHKQAYLRGDLPFNFLADTLTASEQYLLRRAIIHGFQVHWQKHKVQVTDRQKQVIYSGTELNTDKQADAWLVQQFGRLEPEEK